MDDYPEDLIECITENTFLYGTEFFTCPLITTEEQQQFELLGNTAICCVWLPMVFDELDNVELKLFDNIGIPTIWQGLPEKHHVYIETLDILPSELLDEYNEALRDEEVRNKYKKSHLNRILKQMKKLKTKYNENILNLKKGILIKLKPDNVPDARSYPMARIKRILKHDFSRNIEVNRVKLKNGKIISIRNSSGYIDFNDIESILCDSTDPNIQLATYRKQQLLKARERHSKMKQDKKETFNILLKEYLGEKIKAALNETNFKANNNRNKPIEIVCEAMKNDIYNIFIPLIKRIGVQYNLNNHFLDLNIKTATELAKLIGNTAIMNEKRGYEYFLIYPMKIRFGFKWKFPAFKAIFNIGKLNKAGNVER